MIALSPALRRSGMLGLKIAVSAGLLWLLFSRIDIWRFADVARRSSVPWLLTAVAAYLVAVLLCTWRWYRLLQIQNIRMPFRAVLESFLVALFFNNFLPTNIGGDVMRIRDTAGAAGSNTRATTIVVVDRVLGLIGLVLAAALGAAMATKNRLPVSPSVIWLIFAAGLAASAVVLALPARVAGLLRSISFLRGTWIGAQLDALLGSLITFSEAPAAMAGTFVAAVFVQAANVAFYSAVARALGVHVGMWDMAVIVPLSALVQVVPVSINGLGLREAAFTVLFGGVGVAPEQALLISLEATALIMSFSLIGALVYVLRRQPVASLRASSGDAAPRPRRGLGMPLEPTGQNSD